MRIKYEFNIKEITVLNNLASSINKECNIENSNSIPSISDMDITEDFTPIIETDAIFMSKKYNGNKLEIIMDINEDFFSDVIIWGSKFISPIFTFINQIKNIIKNDNPLSKWFKKSPNNINKELFDKGYKYRIKFNNMIDEGFVFIEKIDLINYIIDNNLDDYTIINLKSESKI